MNENKKNLRQIECNGIPCMEKVHYCKERFENELSVYKKNLSHVPRLVSHDNANLILIVELINGDTLDSFDSPKFAQMAKLFAELHEVEKIGEKVLCHQDTNLSNYIVRNSDEKYYMLDFEYSKFDYREVDLIRFLAYWSFLLTAEKYETALNTFFHSYPGTGKFNVNIYKRIVGDTFTEFDKPKWLFGKEGMVSNPDVLINRELLQVYFD